MVLVREADPHHGAPVVTAGARPERARAAVLACHGRGASPEDILSVAGAFDVPEVAYVAPAAAGNTWYPNSFLAPIASNEPWLSSALGVVGDAVERLLKAGMPPERLLLLGFSQGACLALEYAARNARRYGGLVGWSGGLIGPPGTPRDYPGSLEGTPVFLGCSDADPHIPAERVRESAEVLKRIGGAVTVRLYPGLGHMVNEDEIAFARDMLAGIAAGSPDYE